MLIVLGAPAGELVDLERLKQQARIDDSDEDALLQAYLDAAHAYCGKYAGLALALASYEQQFAGWCAGDLALEVAPIREVAAVRYEDEAGVLQTLSTDSWDFYPLPTGGVVKISARPALKMGPGAVRVEFEAGYDDPAQSPADPAWLAPRQLTQAILMLAAYWYKQRETVADASLPEAPIGTHVLLDQVRVYR